MGGTQPGRSDTESAQRSSERFRLARLAVVFGGVERGVAAAVSFARVPLLLWGLDLRDYGLWAAILGIVAAANLLDFGLHFGVVNAVSDSRGRDDREAVSGAIATAFVVYSIVSVTAALVLVPLLSWVPLHAVIGAGEQDAVLVRNVAWVGFAGLILVMPLKVYAASLTGHQEQWVVSLFRSFQAVAQLVALAVAFAVFHVGLLGVAWVGLVSDLLSASLFGLWVERRRPGLRVRPGLASRAQAPILLATGAMFVTINLANLAKTSFGSTIVSYGRGPEAVASLSVPLGLFTIALGLASMIAVSLWPAYGEAAARGEWGWIDRAFTLGSKASLCVAAAFAVLGTFFGADVIRLWAPKAGIPGPALVTSLGVWLVAQAGVNAAATLLNGMGRLRVVAICCVIEGLMVVSASLVVVRAWGANGVAHAMALAGVANAAFLLFVAVPSETGRRIGSPVAMLGRLALCIAAASAIAGCASIALAEARPLVRLFAGAGPVAASLAALFWTVLLTPAERVRLTSAWSRHSAPGVA
ncbi:MAG TPA: hypothetical protein VMW19_21935 [Myxococcota bacterium]|nr:hypothetical protein [Myxococcota bacterium]